MINNQPHYDIIFSTEKAHKIKIEGIEFWICKQWIKSDGSLNRAALRAYEEAKALDLASRKKAKRRSLPKEEIDIEVLIEDAISIGHQGVNLTSLMLIWLKEITSHLALSFEHQSMQDPENKIYAINLWERVAKKIKAN